MPYAHELGNFAEDIAAEYLLSLGWKVLGRNIHNKYGELDITALDTKIEPEELVIVEVRCRTLGKMQTSLESIGFRKVRTLLKASDEYIDKIGWSGFWRLDAIAVTMRDKYDRESWELEHIKDITAGRKTPF